jgi:hypothetical protein
VGDWLESSQDPAAGFIVEALEKAKDATAKIVAVMQCGLKYLEDCQKVSSNSFSPLTSEIVRIQSTHTVLKTLLIQEVFICGTKFFNFFSSRESGIRSFQSFNEREKADWLDLMEKFRDAVRETQELHQTLHMRLLFKFFRCLGVSGDARANDLLLWFHELKHKVRDKEDLLKLDDKFSIAERSIVDFKDHVCPDKFHFAGTGCQVTSYSVCCFNCLAYLSTVRFTSSAY